MRTAMLGRRSVSEETSEISKLLSELLGLERRSASSTNRVQESNRREGHVDEVHVVV